MYNSLSLIHFRTTGIAVVLSGLLLSLIPGTLQGRPGPFVFTPNAAPEVQENVDVQFNRLTLGTDSKLLLGKKIKDSQGQSAGKVSDLLVDLETGRVLAALVSNRGLRVVPATVFANGFADRLELSSTAEAVQQAPRVANAEAARLPEVLAQAFQAFGKTSTTVNQPVLASQCFRQKVTSSDNVLLGYIQDFVVDLVAGRIIYAVIAPTVGPDPQENLYVAPGRAFQWMNDGLGLKATKEHFLASRVVSREFPTDMVLPELARDIYNHYR
jgi:sporulation protein YlmC with PRC-barrel domain